MLQDSVLAAMHIMDSGDWARRLLLCTQLAGRTPAIEAHCLYFCDVTVRAALDILHRRFGLASDDLRPRLALDVLVAAFHRGLDTWTGRLHAATADQLAIDTRAAFAAIPGILTLASTTPSEQG